MQKVSKEYVEDFSRGVLTAPEPKFSINDLMRKECVCDLDSLLSLIRYRESELLKNLTQKTVSKPEKVKYIKPGCWRSRI